ncbi:MAG: hypothetical protein EPO06_11760 [Burkholderiaceae bacterium]|nr:MAG: hypothetical protein EPO06_11760 [Burkholderiaceae bacterium]
MSTVDVGVPPVLAGMLADERWSPEVVDDVCRAGAIVDLGRKIAAAAERRRAVGVAGVVTPAQRIAEQFADAVTTRSEMAEVFDLPAGRSL